MQIPIIIGITPINCFGVDAKASPAPPKAINPAVKII